MTYDDALMWSRSAILAWRNAKRERGSKEGRWRQLIYQRQRQAMREFMSGAGNSLLFRDQLFKWLNSCRDARLIAKHAPDFRDDKFKALRRTIAIIRSTRFENPISLPGRDTPFYFEISSRHVPYEDFRKAEKLGVDFEHVYFTKITLTEFNRMREYLRKAGIEGYWTSGWDIEDEEGDVRNGVKKQAVFMFTDENASDIFAEARVWTMLKYAA